jgi:class 3 adenylate cyclase
LIRRAAPSAICIEQHIRPQDQAPVDDYVRRIAKLNTITAPSSSAAKPSGWPVFFTCDDVIERVLVVMSSRREFRAKTTVVACSRSMTATPETYYARDGNVRVAYQIVGDQGPDLLFVPTPVFPIDLLWDEPTVAGQLGRLASFSRLILTDLLGVGSSDAVPINERPAMQSWSDGLVNVLDAVRSKSASIFAMGEAALPVMLLAARNPDRVRSLVLWSPYASFLRTLDQPFAMPEPALAGYLGAFEDMVGTGALVDVLAPSWAQDAAKRRWCARAERLAGGPGYFAAILDLFLRTDVTPVLSSIQAPTLILRRRGDRHVTGGHARQLAERIGHARMVEFDGDDHGWFAGDAEHVLNEIESFLTGGRGLSPANRVLSTVLFTDIVGSTERAATLGDQAWSTALANHNRVVERHVAGYSGAVVKFTGDGALATFDGPARAINCACAIRDALQDVGLVIRAGLHSGEVEIVDNDVHGIAVHIAARIMALAAPGEVLVSGAIPPLVLGSRIAFANRGSHKLKGLPHSWSVLAVHT